MKNYFSILQLNNVPDNDAMMFMSYKENAASGNYYGIELYKTVWQEYLEPDFDYEAEIGIFLERVFTRFNIDRPLWFKGHSLSVSDVIEICIDGEKMYYYCDTIGFKRILKDGSEA